MIISWVDILDVLIVAIVLYQILVLLKGSRAVPLLRGLLVVFSIYVTGQLLGLSTINWLMERFATAILLMLIVVFQPELRRTLERIGRGRILASFGFAGEQQGTWLIRHIVRAVEYCAENKIGALIVLEQDTGLAEYVESGERLDARISADLLISIFSTRSPLHDGAVIIQGERITACGCLLPLSDNATLDRRLGTRHRAALGLVEQTDAIAVIVSEFSGVISVAENGVLERYMNREMLEERLFRLQQQKSDVGDAWGWFKHFFQREERKA